MDSKWSELIQSQPDPQSAGQRAGRARVRALAEWDASGRAKSRKSWQGAMVAFAAGAAALAFTFLPPAAVVEQKFPAPVAAERLVMQLHLSDGTQVQWTFDDRFSM